MPDTPLHKIREPLPPPTSVTPGAMPYAELDVTSNFSFLRGASHPDELVHAAALLGYRALAITDRNSLAGVVRAHAAARQCGLKLLVGARLTLRDAPDLLVWCQDRCAYARLCRLITTGKRDVEKGRFDLSLEQFLADADGLEVAIDLLSSRERMENPSIPEPLLSLRPRLSLAVSRLYEADHPLQLSQMQSLSRRFGVPLLATNAVHYHDPARRPLQDVLTCVREHCTLDTAGYRLFQSPDRFLKPPDQMHRLFADCPEAIARGLEIAGRCSFVLDELRYEYPHELVPPGKRPIEHLADLAWQGAAERYPAGVPEKVATLIRRELALIEQLRYEPYFLTVHDLVVFARARGILCQGRGSAANSAVCFAIGVTSVDPAKIDVLFERFVSAARNEPPDIDVDFEHERREEVIQYVYRKYGRDRAGMTATLITYRGRSAIREVGKALGLASDMVDSMARRLDWWHRGVLSEAQIRESGCDPHDPTIQRVIALATELLGFPRHLGQHTGGMVMTRGLLCELVPIENASMPDRTVIEWDKDDIEELGLLKVDILALGMLTVISKAFSKLDRMQNAEGRAGTGDSAFSVQRSSISLHTIPSEDPLVYDMICDADTIGVFQIESRAQMSMLPRLRPRCFYDLVIEVAIVRPGPIQGNMVHPYLRRRCGQEQVSYPSQALREVLHKTLGVPLFQEQAMKIAMVAAGFSAEEADQLRRAMAAWRRTDKLESFREKILRGMAERGYTSEFAEQCFNQIKGFGEYGFPESHSASFALLVYASAWIKRHHPAVFCCAILNSQPMGFYAPAQLVRDAREHGVEVRPVDVNHSDWDCTLEDRPEQAAASRGPSPKHTWGDSEPAVRLGLRRVKGLPRAEADRLVAARRRVGWFTSLEHLQHAAGLSRATLQRLAEADAFASLGRTRRLAVWDALELDDVKRELIEEGTQGRRDEGTERCGDGGTEEETSTSSVESSRHVADNPSSLPSIPLPPMPIGQEVLTDYATTGLSLKRHPVSLVRETLGKQKILPAREANALRDGRWVRVCGLVLVRQRPGTASGIVFFTLEDESGVVNLIVRPNVFERYRPAARHATLLQCDGYVERQGAVVHVMAKRLFDRSDLLEGGLFESRDFH
jgi:error-prone DNA polymerase